MYRLTVSSLSKSSTYQKKYEPFLKYTALTPHIYLSASRKYESVAYLIQFFFKKQINKTLINIY